jgi:hypothetical protein
MDATLVPALWAAVVVLALPDALVAPHAHGPAYVAANVFLFFAALLLLAHAASKGHVSNAAKTSNAPPDSSAYMLLPTTLTPQTLTPQTLTPQTRTPQTRTPQTRTPQTTTPQTTTPQTHQPSPVCCERTKTHPHTPAELPHLFVHVLCLAYVRTACWFEFRALAAARARPS